MFQPREATILVQTAPVGQNGKHRFPEVPARHLAKVARLQRSRIHSEVQRWQQLLAQLLRVSVEVCTLKFAEQT